MNSCTIYKAGLNSTYWYEEQTCSSRARYTPETNPAKTGWSAMEEFSKALPLIRGLMLNEELTMMEH